MARADLLLALVRSGAGGDDLAFRRAAEALIAEEEGKKHGVLASQLAEALTRRQPNSNVSPLARNDAAAGLLHELEPERRVSELVLPPAARQTINELVEEHHRRDLLRSHGVEPRHRILLVGPPGGGKTSLGEALATELALPLLSVRYEGLIGSFLGETASRLETLFAAVRIRPCVLFFDEFDAVAKERGDTHETGEIKRVVSSLLLQVDKLPSYVVVVATALFGVGCSCGSSCPSRHARRRSSSSMLGHNAPVSNSDSLPRPSQNDCRALVLLSSKSSRWTSSVDPSCPALSHRLAK
jgi:hypothetical protein